MKFESDASWSLATRGVRASQQITPLDSGLCYSVAESRCLLKSMGMAKRFCSVLLDGWSVLLDAGRMALSLRSLHWRWEFGRPLGGGQDLGSSGVMLILLRCGRCKRGQALLLGWSFVHDGVGYIVQCGRDNLSANNDCKRLCRGQRVIP